MAPVTFCTPDGRSVPAVTAVEMRAVDRVATEELGLSRLMMMGHAGRALADRVHDVAPAGAVAVLAGGGGNGGGGLCAARHLVNHGREVLVVLDRDAMTLDGAAARQWRVLGGSVDDRSDDPAAAIADAAVAVDALIGYGLAGPPRGRAGELVGLLNDRAERLVSLDVPTGLDATTGERPGVAVEPDVTVTLALPKAGLAAVQGEPWLADIGIPARVYDRVGIDCDSPFVGGRWQLPLSGEVPT